MISLSLAGLVLLVGIVVIVRNLIGELDSSDGDDRRSVAGQVTTTPDFGPTLTVLENVLAGNSGTPEGSTGAVLTPGTASPGGQGSPTSSPSAGPIGLTFFPPVAPATRTVTAQATAAATATPLPTNAIPTATPPPTQTQPPPQPTATIVLPPPTVTPQPPPPTSTATASAPTATPEIIGLEADVTLNGTVSASSEYSASFPVSLAVDWDESTSWFSAGPEAGGGATIFRWDSTTDYLISGIDIISNAGHSNPDFRTGFGFTTVTVQILDAADLIVYEETFALDGTPDPDIFAYPDVTGRAVVLLLSGHEDPTCGGFSEFTVWAAS